MSECGITLQLLKVNTLLPHSEHAGFSLVWGVPQLKGNSEIYLKSDNVLCLTCLKKCTITNSSQSRSLQSEMTVKTSSNPVCHFLCPVKSV